MFKIGDRVRVTERPKDLGVIVSIPRNGIVMIKLGREQEGVNHVIVGDHEIEAA